MRIHIPAFNKVRLLLAAALGVCAFTLVIYLQDIPQRIDRGQRAQAAIRQLDAMRRPMLEIKALENRAIRSGDFVSLLPEFDRINERARRILDEYLGLAAYNDRLLAQVKAFSRSYTEWLTRERWMFSHIDHNDQDPHHELKHYAAADRQLLQALSELALGEEPLHADIHHGEQAVQLAQTAAITLMVYLFLLIILFQRSSNRAIAVREQDLETTLHSIGDAVIATDIEGRVTRMNPVAEELTGWCFDEAQGMPLNEIFVIEHATTGEAVDSPVEQVLKEGHVVGLANHTVLLSRDGNRYQIADSAAPIKTAGGEIRGVILVFHDVTLSYDVQQTVREQASRLNNIIETSMDAIIAADENGTIVEWNTQAEKIFGWNRDEILGQYLHETIIPEQYRKMHLQGIERLRKTGRENILNQRVEVSALHKSGSEFPVELTISQLEIKDGCFFSAFVRDLTDIRKAEEELKLAATTFYTHSGIVITDENRRILRVNPALEEMTGYSAEEMIGDYPSMLKSGRQDSNFYRKMWQQINENGTWQGELWNKRKNGSLYAELLTITAVKDETGKVTHYVGTSHDSTERKFAEDRIEQLAYYDDLTNLANRRLLLDRLNHEIAVGRRHNTYGAVLYLDLDRFKNLNDALGHPVGDELLRQVARRLSDLVRAEDTVCRLGGDEFVIMLPAASTEMSKASLEAGNVADKVRSSLAEAFDLHGYQYFLNTSIGIVVFPEDDEGADDILKHADSALYRAKEEGRNTTRFYKPAMQEDADARLQLEKDLRNALQNDELVLYYQPQVSIDGHVTGAEALLRWQHPRRGMVSPAEFIPLAEETGLILDIGHRVLQQAGIQLARWQDNGISLDSRTVAVNVSPRQFHQVGFVEEIISMMKASGLDARCLELEITESLLMERMGDVVTKLSSLREHGVRIAIDDFGTGYSSLGYLKSLPLDKLKIDQSFVQDINVDNNDAAIVDTIIAMSRHLGLDVIAEGVETKVQLDFLHSKGCKVFQGYYFSRAVSADEMLEIMKKGSINQG